MIRTCKVRPMAVVAVTWCVSAAASAAVLPVTTDLVLHLNASSGVEEAIGDPAENGDPVVRWLDQSTAGNDHVSGTSFGGATDPVYQTGALYNQPAVNFDQQTDRLETGSPILTGTTDFSFFALVQGSTSPAERIIGGNYGLGGGGGAVLRIYQKKLDLFHVGALVGATELQDGVWYIVEAEKSGPTYTLRVNNAVDAVGALSGLFLPIVDWTIGGGTNYDHGGAPLGLLPELILYDRALTEGERDLVIGYFRNSYGLLPEPGVGAMFVTGLMAMRRRRGPCARRARR